MQKVFVNPAGQDDNLGDSILRVGLLRALREPGTQLHVHLDGQSSDYLAGLPLLPSDKFYERRSDWVKASRQSQNSAIVVNAGEINPQASTGWPHPRRVAELRGVTARNGVVIAVGMGIKSPGSMSGVAISDVVREAAVVSWRDHESRDAAGFGDVAPDWAFSLGAPSESWRSLSDRNYLAVTLRYDRPWPSDSWFGHIRSFASERQLRVVTVAQVARDAPRAVKLALALGGEYLTPSSMSHDDLEAYVREIYANAVAVLSDRAHALIMGATEGAVPLGSAVDPQKISRLLRAAGVGSMTGHHDGLAGRLEAFDDVVNNVAPAIDRARGELDALTARVRSAINSL